MPTDPTTTTVSAETTRRRPLLSLLCVVLIAVLASVANLLTSAASVPHQLDDVLPPLLIKQLNAYAHELREESEVTVATIAYAVTVTSCTKKPLVLDGAAVLQHSIHLQSIRTPSSGSKYDYQMVAFVHENAIECVELFKSLNYTVMTKEVPFQISQVRGSFKKWANRTGCCGEKEWLKLYAYTLQQYPVVAHLDLDCLVLKPLDDLFDAMILDTEASTDARERIPAMWKSTEELPERIDFFFTRDYGMTEGKKPPHKVGVQGGFLVVRPSQPVFDEYIEIILEGNYTESHGWGDRLGYGGFYGAGTIQGLAALYYSHLHPEHAVELNRCIYNNMADRAYSKIHTNKCKTQQETCQDCREMAMTDIYSFHLTNCGKPWHCQSREPHLCKLQFYEWFRIRHLMEASHGAGNGTIVPRIPIKETTLLKDMRFGFCQGNQYQPMNQRLLLQ